MARRRRRNARYGALLLLISGLLALALLQWLLQLVAAHSMPAFLAAMVTLGFVIAMTVLAIRVRRERYRRQAELDRNVAVTDGMSGPQFEQYIARLMRRDGLNRVEVCGGSGDLGADVTAYTSGTRTHARHERTTAWSSVPRLSRHSVAGVSPTARRRTGRCAGRVVLQTFRAAQGPRSESTGGDVLRNRPARDGASRHADALNCRCAVGQEVTEATGDPEAVQSVRRRAATFIPAE